MHRVVSPPEDQRHFRRLGVFHFAHFINGVPISLLPSKKVQEEGRVIFPGKIPTTDEWEVARIKSYGVGEFIKGDVFDTEIISGIEVNNAIQLSTKNINHLPIGPTLPLTDKSRFTM